MGKKCEFTVEAETGLAALLSNSVVGLSRSKADTLVKSGEVRVNGVKTRTNAKLSVGDTVTVFVPDSLIISVPVPVVYEDDNIVVFDKPKHLPFDAIPNVFGKQLFAVHRLDTNTAGLIVFAKTENAQKVLLDAFKDRRVEKRYDAAVYPAPERNRDILTAYMKMNEGSIASVSLTRGAGMKTAVTEYEVKERIGGAAIISVFPHTGRTHQIRAHLSFIGSPIIGDPKYGKKLVGAPDTQMLTAVSIKFFFADGELKYLDGKRFTVDNRFDLDFLRNAAVKF